MNTIERRLELKAAPERVWRALTDGQELGQWFPDAGAKIEARAGADGWFEWQSHGRFAMRVEEVEPIRRLVWRWARRPDTELGQGVSTLVEWTLTPRDGGGTLLEVTESGFEDIKHWESNSAGWDAELGQLEDFLEASA